MASMSKTYVTIVQTNRSGFKRLEGGAALPGAAPHRCARKHGCPRILSRPWPQASRTLRHYSRCKYIDKSHLLSLVVCRVWCGGLEDGAAETETNRGRGGVPRPDTPLHARMLSVFAQRPPFSSPGRNPLDCAGCLPSGLQSGILGQTRAHTLLLPGKSREPF